MRLVLTARLREYAERMPEADAVVSDDRRLSHTALRAAVLARASHFAKAGIGQGTATGIAIADEVEHFIASLALLLLGARQVTLASHDTAEVHAALARRLGLTHQVADAEAQAIGDAKPVRLSGPAGAAAEPLGDTNAGIVYLSTSGTTGDAKIVGLGDRQLAAQAAAHENYAGQRLLRLGSIEHNISKRLRLYCAYQGGTNVFAPPGQVDIVACCLRHGVTALDASRLHAADLAARPDAGRLAHIALSVAGAPLPHDARLSIARVLPRLIVRYGATECGTIAWTEPGVPDADEPVGRPVAGIELQIVDAEGRALAAGETGQVRVRGPGVATGYLDSPEDDARRFRDGWFHPGDVGLLRPDGQLVIRGREDEMMILNGINIFPAEIERTLERHAAVRAAAAFALPSAVHGSIPMAAVELEPGSTASPAELLAYAREALALRAPRRIVIVETLPRNAQGKIVRRELAAAVQNRG